MEVGGPVRQPLPEGAVYLFGELDHVTNRELMHLALGVDEQRPADPVNLQVIAEGGVIVTPSDPDLVRDLERGK